MPTELDPVEKEAAIAAVKETKYSWAYPGQEPLRKTVESLSDACKNNKDVMLAAIAKGHICDSGNVGLNLTPVDFRGDKDVALAVIKAGGTTLYGRLPIFQTLAMYHADDKDIVMAAVKAHGYALEYASDALKADRGIVLAAVTSERGNVKGEYVDFALACASDALKDDHDIVLAAVAAHGGALQHASEVLKDNQDVVLAAVKQDGSALQHASEALKANQDVVLAAVKQDGSALQHASEALKANQDVVLAAVKQDGGALQHASEALKANQDVVLAAVKQDDSAFKLASDDLKNNVTIVKAAVEQNVTHIREAGDDAKNNVDIATVVLSKDPGLLSALATSDAAESNTGIVLVAIDKCGAHKVMTEFASGEAKADKAVMLAAVENETRMLQYASIALQNDRDLVKAAVKKDHVALEHASDALKGDRQFVLSLLVDGPDYGQNSADLLKFASGNLLKDPTFACEAIKRTPAALSCFGDLVVAGQKTVVAAAKRALVAAFKSDPGDGENWCFAPASTCNILRELQLQALSNRSGVDSSSEISKLVTDPDVVQASKESFKRILNTCQGSNDGPFDEDCWILISEVMQPRCLLLDKEIALLCLSKTAISSKDRDYRDALPVEMLCDKDFMLQAANVDGDFLSIMLEMEPNHGFKEEYINVPGKSEPVLHHVYAHYDGDPYPPLAAVQAEFRKDKDLIMAAVKSTPKCKIGVYATHILKLASDELTGDREFMTEALKHVPEEERKELRAALGFKTKADKKDDDISAKLNTTDEQLQKETARGIALEALKAASPHTHGASGSSGPELVGDKTVTALGEMLVDADLSTQKAAVRALSALTSASNGNAEKVAKDDTTLTALVGLSSQSSGSDSADATAIRDVTTIRLYAAKAMANMSSSSSKKTAAAVLKDPKTAENVITSALAVKVAMVKSEAVTSTLSLKDAEKLMHQLQQNQLSFETVELARGMAESLTGGTDDSNMAETLLKSSFESLVAMVVEDNVQTAVSATATLKRLFAVVPAESTGSVAAKQAVVNAVHTLTGKPDASNNVALDRLRTLVPPNDLLALLSVQSGATTEDPAFKLMQTTIAHMQEKFEEFEVMLKGASASTEELRLKVEHDAKVRKVKGEHEMAAIKKKLLVAIKGELQKDASPDAERLKELENQMKTNEIELKSMASRLSNVENTVAEMSVEYLLNREIEDERNTIAVDPPLEAFRRGLMSDLSSNLLQKKMMGDHGAGGLEDKVAMMDTLFGAIPFGVGSVIGTVAKYGAKTKDIRDKKRAEAKHAASIFTDITAVTALLEMVVRAITLRHQEAIRRLDNPSANRFGRWCAVAVLLYVISDDVGTTPWAFVEGCLLLLDTFEFEKTDTDKVTDKLAASEGAVPKEKKRGLLSKIKSGLKDAVNSIKGKFKAVVQKALDGLAGTGPSGKGTLTRFEQSIHGSDTISFKDLLRHNGLKVMRDDGKYKYYSKPASGSGGPYVVYKVDVLIGPFREIAENRARIQYSAQENKPPNRNNVCPVKPHADGLTPHSVELLQLEPVSLLQADDNPTPIGGGGGGGGGSSAAVGATTGAGIAPAKMLGANVAHATAVFEGSAPSFSDISTLQEQIDAMSEIISGLSEKLEPEFGFPDGVDL